MWCCVGLHAVLCMRDECVRVLRAACVLCVLTWRVLRSACVFCVVTVDWWYVSPYYLSYLQSSVQIPMIYEVMQRSTRFNFDSERGGRGEERSPASTIVLRQGHQWRRPLPLLPLSLHLPQLPLPSKIVVNGGVPSSRRLFMPFYSSVSSLPASPT